MQTTPRIFARFSWHPALFHSRLTGPVSSEPVHNSSVAWTDGSGGNSSPTRGRPLCAKYLPLMSAPTALGDAPPLS